MDLPLYWSVRLTCLGYGSVRQMCLGNGSVRQTCLHMGVRVYVFQPLCESDPSADCKFPEWAPKCSWAASLQMGGLYSLTFLFLSW